MSMTFLRTSVGDLRLPIEGLTISRCCVEHALILEIYIRDQTASLRVDNIFRFAEGEKILELDPSKPIDLGPCLVLFGAVVSRAVAGVKGILSL
jgi:hypothetical protein